MSLTEALEAARAYRAAYDPGDVIDAASGFSALHLDLLIEWADTCGDSVAAADDEQTIIEQMDLTQLSEEGLADYYFSEIELDPDGEGNAARLLRAEVVRRGLTDEQLSAAWQTMQARHESLAQAERLDDNGSERP
jgi:hypothetical protein